MSAMGGKRTLDLALRHGLFELEQKAARYIEFLLILSWTPIFSGPNLVPAAAEVAARQLLSSWIARTFKNLAVPAHTVCSNRDLKHGSWLSR